MRNNPIFEGVIQTGSKRMRFDILVRPCADFPDGLIVDLKTTVDCSPFAFSRTVQRLAYHIQAAWYVDLCAEVKKFEPEFLVIAAETSRPFICAPYVIDSEDLEIGRGLAENAYERILECMSTGVWPAYHTEPEPIKLPNWVYSEIENEAEITLGDE